MQVMGNQIYWQTKPSIPSTIGCYQIPYREGRRPFDRDCYKYGRTQRFGFETADVITLTIGLVRFLFDYWPLSVFLASERHS